MTQYRKGLFQFESDPAFPGLTDDSSWNGWAKPLFETQVAIEALTSFHFSYSFHEDGSLTFGDEHGMTRSEPIEINGVPHYRLHDICWDEVPTIESAV